MTCRGCNVSGTLEHVHLLLIMFFEKFVFLLKKSEYKKRKTLVHVQLPCRIELAGLWLHKLPTLSCCLLICS
jgi:hypothetical protein